MSQVLENQVAAESPGEVARRPLIRLENIFKTYHVGELDVPVLKGVSLEIFEGEMVALMGASGSGKTTLMNILGCLDRPTSGEYFLDGQPTAELSADGRAILRTQKLGFVFQSFNLLPRTSALNNVRMPVDYAISTPPAKEISTRAHQLLELVGLETRMDHHPSQLSGGQQQRVAIARSLMNFPRLLLADEPTGNLDSVTSKEILALFQELNELGITIVIVTHEPDIAQHAKRIVWMRDGRIEQDTLPKQRIIAKDSADNSSSTSAQRNLRIVEQYRAASTKSTRRLPHLGLGQTMITSLRALQRNKMRSLLTTLGVIIGVGAVIAMMEIGQGSKKALQQTIASMGANNLMVQPGAASSGGVTLGFGSILTLTPQDGDEVGRQCPAVDRVAPIVRARTQIVYGNKNWVPLNINGTTPDYLYVRDWEDMAEGQPFTEQDVRNGSAVCIVGQTIAREVFNSESPVGKELRIQNVPFRVVGVLSRKGANMMGMDQDDIVLAPWTTIKFRVSGNTLANVNQSAQAQLDTSQKVNTLANLYPGTTPLYPVPSPNQAVDTPQPVRFINVDQLLLKGMSAEEIPASMDQVTALLNERHHIRAGQTSDFNLRDMAEVSKALSSTSDLMTTLLLCVACISLVVGGVGIMNIMLVSVTERTKEIGLRMAVGARAHHILQQFLTEAVVLCLGGGAIGIAIGRLTSSCVRYFLQWPTELSIPAVIAAVAVSAGVGIIFGFYPAWKASRLDPIEALRYE
jgi:macrolide transport system ATP-binding/permease protein